MIKMSNDMDSDDKSFFSKLIEGVEKKIDKIDIHLEKTCDEVAELDKKMVRFDERLENHLKITEKNKISTEKNKRAKKEWIMIAITLVASISATVTLVHNWV